VYIHTDATAARDGYTVAECLRPSYRLRENETVVGAVRSYRAVSEDKCKDDCARDLSCVGVDVNYLMVPVECWPHTNKSDYRDNNIFTQPGTNSYELLERCRSTGGL